MNVKTIVGLALVISGVLALIYRGVPYTTREEVVNFGPLRATTETEEIFPIPSPVGALVLIGGIVLVLMGAQRK